MSLCVDPDDDAGSLLCAPDGQVLARLTFRDDDGEQVAARVQPVVRPLAAVVAQARHDLAGLRLDTADDDLAAALVADGLALRRTSTTLRRDLVDLPEPAALPVGWSWRAPGWDDDLERALEAAYASGHPDGRWAPDDTKAVRDIVEPGLPVPPLGPASGRVAGPDGRSAGHVLTAGPVPWTEDTCGWVLNLAVGPSSQGQGLGRALLGSCLCHYRSERSRTLPRQVANCPEDPSATGAVACFVTERCFTAT